MYGLIWASVGTAAGYSAPCCCASWLATRTLPRPGRATLLLAALHAAPSARCPEHGGHAGGLSTGPIVVRTLVSWSWRASLTGVERRFHTPYAEFPSDG